MNVNKLLSQRPDLLKLWGGQVLSMSGTRMYQIALSWWILAQSGDRGGLLMGILLMLSSLPAVFFAKLIGRWVDQIDCRKLLVASDTLAGVLCTGLAVVSTISTVSLWQVYTLGFLLAFFQAIVDPAINKAIPQITPPEETEAAVSLIVSTGPIASLTGALFGAVAIQSLGLTGSLWLNGASYLVASLLSITMQFRQLAPTGPQSDRDTGVSGWAILNESPLLKQLLIGFGLINFFGTPALLIIPIYVKNILGASASVLALMEVALWFGFVVGAFATRLVPTQRNSIFLGGVGMLVWGASTFVAGIFTHAVIYAALLFMGGCFLAMTNVKFVTLFQNVVPEQIKGRFFALLSAMASFAFPIAFLIFGLLSDYFEATLLSMIQGVGVMVLSAWYIKISSREVELWT